MRNDDRSKISWAGLALVVPSTCVFFISEMLVAAFARNEAVFTAPPPFSAAQAILDDAGGFYLLAALMAAGGIGFLTLLLFCNDMAEEFGRQMRRKLLATLAFGIGLGVLWRARDNWTFEPGSAFAAYQPSQLIGPGFVGGHVDGLARCGSALLMLGAAIVIVGGVSCLATSIAPLDPAEEAAFIARQRRRLRGYVDAAATLLVVALALGLAWMRLPLDSLTGEMKAAYLAQVNARSAFMGVSYTLVIALFALPVSTVLRDRAAALPRIESDDSGAGSDNLLGSVGKILVVLAPSLAGALPAMIDFASKLGG